MKPLLKIFPLGTIAFLGGLAHGQLTYTTGLDVWLDASDLDGSGNSTLSDGQAITGWTNKGTTADATDGVVIGGGTTLSVGGGDGGYQDALVLNDTRHQFGQEWGNTADCTMYFVVWQGANAGGEGTLLTDYGDVTSKLRLLRSGEDQGGAAGAYTRDAQGDAINNSHGAMDLADETWAVIFYSFDSTTGTSTWGELGSEFTATDAAYDAATTFEGSGGGPVTLFSFHDGNNGNDFNGLVSEVLIYDHLLDAGQRTQVEDYLQSKTEIPDEDGDGIADDYELAHTDPPSTTALDPALDDDTDGLTNLQEFLGLDANDADHGFGQTKASAADSDGDGADDNDEITGILNIYQTNVDGDPPGVAPGSPTDPNDPDSDNDELTDGEELTPGTDGVATNPLAGDTDGDGMGDSYEATNSLLGGLDPTDAADAFTDLDGDGLLNIEEHDASPQTRADKEDTDDDGYDDLVEDSFGSWDSTAATGTDPTNPDTDGDGLLDGQENPDLASDNPPTQYASDPNVFDSDNDGYGDGDEVTAGSSVTDNTSVPAPPAGIAFQLDFHMENASNQEIQPGWAFWDVNRDTQPISISRTSGAIGLTVTAGGAGAYLTSRGGPETERGGDITGTSFDDVVEDLLVARNGDGTLTLDFTGLAPTNSYTLVGLHNDPYTFGANPGFAIGDPSITPSVTTGTLLGSPIAGQATNVRPGARSDADFLNSSVSFTTDASGNASIVLASSSEFVVLSGFSLEDYVPPAADLRITDAGFNLSDEFEITVTGLDTSKSYVLKRSADLADGFPVQVGTPWTPASGTETVVDDNPPTGEAFYRVEEETP